MTKLHHILIASALGSAATYGLISVTTSMNSPEKTIEIKHTSPEMSKQVAMFDDVSKVNFKAVSKSVMPAVVHIKSIAKRTPLVQKQYDPFKHLFRDRMFEDFFGPQAPPSQPRNNDEMAEVGSGSGVIINKNGYIVTNNHVIDNAEEIEVVLNTNKTYKATLIGTDESTDLALIQIKGDDFPHLAFSNSDEIEIGEWVMAVGNPFNLTSTATAGIVSAKGRNINILKDKFAIESFIQTDAAINPGNSGGALVDLSGGLVGINTAIASPTGAYAGYGFAIPSNIVNKVIEDLLKFGTVQRGYLGAMIRDLDDELISKKDLKITQGVYIDSVLNESAAEEAGLLQNDIITSVNDRKVKSSAEFLGLMARHRPGDVLDLVILRKGKEVSSKVKLRNKEGSTKIVAESEMTALSRLGCEVETISKDLASELKISGGCKVLNLRSGKLKSQTSIKEGFIITKVNGDSVKSKEGLIKILENAEGGVMFEGVYEDYPGVHYYAFGL